MTRAYTGDVERVKPITVADLIEFLKQQPQGIPVAYRCCSEDVLLELKDIEVMQLQPARFDGWVHDARPDRETIDYLVFPGN